jgi:hypothetical protein
VVPVDPKRLKTTTPPIPVAPRPNLANRIHDGETALKL